MTTQMTRTTRTTTMTSPTPSDPVTPMQEGAAGIHELFVSMIGQGFTEYQACVILGVMLSNGATGNQTGDR